MTNEKINYDLLIDEFDKAISALVAITVHLNTVDANFKGTIKQLEIDVRGLVNCREIAKSDKKHYEQTTRNK